MIDYFSGDMAYLSSPHSTLRRAASYHLRRGATQHRAMLDQAWHYPVTASLINNNLTPMSPVDVRRALLRIR